MKLLFAKTYCSFIVFVIYFTSRFPGCLSSIRCFFSFFLLLSTFSIDPLLVLIEYVPYGDLLGYLRKSRGLNDTYFKDPDVKPQTSLTAEQLMRFAWQVADGMLYLSSRKVWLQSSFFDLIVHWRIPLLSRCRVIVAGILDDSPNIILQSQHRTSGHEFLVDRERLECYSDSSSGF